MHVRLLAGIASVTNTLLTKLSRTYHHSIIASAISVIVITSFEGQLR